MGCPTRTNCRAHLSTAWIGIVTPDRSLQIRRFFGIVFKRVGQGLRVDLQIHCGLRRMLEANGRFEAKVTRCLRKADESDAIAENVVNPSDVFRLRIDLQVRTQKRLIEAVPWPEQQSVLPKRHAPFVPVGGDMLDAEYRHPATR